MHKYFITFKLKKLLKKLLILTWRKRQDLNLRGPFDPTHFPGVRLKPLGHSSLTNILTQLNNNTDRQEIANHGGDN